MRLVEVFSHRLRSSRRYVFENIMDLDHVAVVHRRWFRNVRPLVRRAEYVEYALQSHFFGLRMEILARGGSIDSNRYWYEFQTPFAMIRVDGDMEGPDGDLTQVERITYTFPAILAPLFLILRPVFRSQKLDILADDTRLLEREYDLEAKGYRRPAQSADDPVVVVFGGDGFFGRLLVRDLLTRTSAAVRIVSRRPKSIPGVAEVSRLLYVPADINDRDAVRKALTGSSVAVNCIGPFQGQPTVVLEACMDVKVPYIDVADDRDFVGRVGALADQARFAGIPVLAGCSVVPGISTVLAVAGSMGLDTVKSVHIFISPGTKYPRGPGSFRCLLSTLGEPIHPIRDGKPMTVLGWSGRMVVEFPSPMGRRWTYLVVDIADYDLLPPLTGAQTVEFRIGSELDWLNHGLTALRWMKRVIGRSGVEALLPLWRGMIGMASVLGTSQGGVLVRVAGERGGIHVIREWCVLSDEGGEVIPAILASVAVERILRGEKFPPGLVAAGSWIGAEDLTRECLSHGVRVLSRVDGGPWSMPEW